MCVYFISGIDTDSGKSIATGVIARTLKEQGHNVITQKFIQTGCQGISEDILTHRRLMGGDLYQEDKEGLTCPYVMSYPASPHLAAQLDKVEIDTHIIHSATEKLKDIYDIVLLEGAGGLYVPVTTDFLTIDYILQYNYPLILVASSKLGSINHTLMSLELCRLKGVNVKVIVYNHFPNDSEIIKEDTIKVINRYICEYMPYCKLIELPVIEGENYPELNIL